MKKIFLLSSLLIFVLVSMAQVRVTDRSGRKPSWVNGLETGYIIGSGTADNITQAQKNALNMIKRRIVTAVAENVRSSSELRIEEQTVNNKVNLFLENFAVETKTESADVPFLKGISLSKAEDYYWEKTRNRNTGVEVYNYHIKYPFPEMELQKLVLDFTIRDKRLSNELEDILSSISEINNIDDIESKISELRILADYFMDSRKDRALLGIKRLENIYNSIQIVEKKHSLGQLKYELRLNNKLIETASQPRVSSECARITDVSQKSNYNVINYDFQNCYDDPENHIKVVYRYGRNSIENRFYFDINADKVDVYINEPIRIISDEKNEDVVKTAKLYVTITSAHNSPFKINKLILDIPGHGTLYLNNINKKFSGKGNHSLEVPINDHMQIEQTSTIDKRRALLSGHLHFSSINTGESGSYRIFNHSYSTNW